MSEYTDDNYHLHPAINAYGTIVKNPSTNVDTVRPVRARFKLDARKDTEYRSILSAAHKALKDGKPWSYRRFVMKCWTELLINRTPQELKEDTDGEKWPDKMDANVRRAIDHFLAGKTGSAGKQLWATPEMKGEKFHQHYFWEFPEPVAYAVFSGAAVNGARAWLKACSVSIEAKHVKLREADDVSALNKRQIINQMSLEKQFGFTGDRTIKAATPAKPKLLDIATDAGFDFGL